MQNSLYEVRDCYDSRRASRAELRSCYLFSGSSENRSAKYLVPCSHMESTSLNQAVSDRIGEEGRQEIVIEPSGITTIICRGNSATFVASFICSAADHS